MKRYTFHFAPEDISEIDHAAKVLKIKRNKFVRAAACSMAVLVSGNPNGYQYKRELKQGLRKVDSIYPK